MIGRAPGLALGAAVLVAAAPAAQDGLSGRLLDGAPFAAGAADGRVTVVSVWASWCVPCWAELPALDAYYRRHRDAGLRVVAIGMDAGGSARTLRAATAGLALPLARLHDVRLPRGRVPTWLPAMRVYDRAGVLRFDSAGDRTRPLDAAMLERVVTPLLGP